MQHLQVTVGVAEGGDRAATNKFLDGSGLFDDFCTYSGGQSIQMKRCAAIVLHTDYNPASGFRFVHK
ncbi:MAG: hypothetical protein JOZ17_10535 [Acetobacteraceae bacterium]|nr:hypothetical protein [Acetobacteraceae bacterium]